MSVSSRVVPPKYRLHRARNVAVVRLGGRDIYYAAYPRNSEIAAFPASAYGAPIAEWL